MTYSFKTLIIAAMLFVSSILIIGAMHLPLFSGADGFESMESSFNSLRKGIKPPFQKIENENTEYLGKNIRITLVFRDNDEARIATMMFLRNKLTVTPKGRKVNIQGDLGYTLKFFMNDIHLLYMNNFDKLERRYSMPATQSMYYLNRILQKMAKTMGAQKKYPQEKLIKKIREKLLIPAYNLRQALPVSETSGFFYLSMGTLGILLFAILWDISNFLFFGTLASDDFMKTIRVKMGREMSDEQKKRLALKKKKIAKAKAMKKKKAEQGEKVKSTRTNKEALKKKTKPKAKPDDSAAAPKKAVQKKAVKKTTDGTKTARPVEKQPAAKKKRPLKKDAEGKPLKKTAPAKKTKEPTSQNPGKKVTSQQGSKKAASKPKAKPDGDGKTTKKPTAEAAKKKPVKAPKAAQKEIKPDEQ
ncbi:hypothetical protein [Desulfovibrio sp. JC010]|uniref:hypothetical protein n=1 Tax=Desulfovibrio sp. JC010 TaxID=2593641 RepID=UPI0013D46BF9|nr:hypothetical protein [Desulfovibrio sp. JC010]NDV28937.1 hypothetical protein [Desulfovibrio sp. JC010]